MDEGEIDNVTNTLKRIIDRKSQDLDPGSRADRVVALCFQHNLFATRDDEQGRVLVGTLDRYLGSVDVDADWQYIEDEIFAMSITELWD